MQHDVLTEPQGDGAVHGNGRSDAASAADNVAGGESSGAVALPPLTVSALMATKAALIRALRMHLPHLSDIKLIDGGRFLLTIGSDHRDAQGSR